MKAGHPACSLKTLSPVSLPSVKDIVLNALVMDGSHGDIASKILEGGHS
jgi:hypothetical protein